MLMTVASPFHQLHNNLRDFPPAKTTMKAKPKILTNLTIVFGLAIGRAEY